MLTFTVTLPGWLAGILALLLLALVVLASHRWYMQWNLKRYADGHRDSSYQAMKDALERARKQTVDAENKIFELENRIKRGY